MNQGYYQIGNPELLASAALIGAVVILNYIERTKLVKDLIIGTLRCFAQLILVGYVLMAIFGADKWYWVILALIVMTFVAGVEAVRREQKKAPGTFIIVTGIIFISTMFVMFFAITFIIRIDTWYNPQYLIPIMGMLIGNAMNGASLLVNRLRSELSGNREVIEAKLALGADKKTASRKYIGESIRAAMIPSINSLMIVGLVSLPGMMTGQIIAGASPLEAVKYQVAIMYMITTANALTIFIIASLLYRQYFTVDHQIREDLL
jgi:putative ABC transport system permease protein